MTNDKDNNQGNPFFEIKTMMAASIGKIPASLVIILVLGVVLALLSGLLLEMVSRHKATQAVFMPQRLEATENASVIDVKRLQGRWVVQSPDYAMTLSFIGDRFEWIVRFANIQEAQFYARGNYRIVGDVMILGQRPDLGHPYDPSQPWMKYMPIAMKDINAMFKVDGKKMIWDVPLSEREKILSHTMRIFNTPNQGNITWIKK